MYAGGVQLHPHHMSGSKVTWVMTASCCYTILGNVFLLNGVFSRPSCMPVVAIEIVGQTNQRSVTAGAQALSAHYIMQIRPPQALSLVIIYEEYFYFQISL